MTRPGHRRRLGFTLMETLVMLVLVSLSVLLMFQMLGSYRIARERVQAQAGDVDREGLFAAWLADSIGGLHPLPAAPFRGDAEGFEATTLNPLFASPGAPASIEWHLEPASDGGWSVAYTEGGEPRWTLPMETDGAPRFAYLDDSGASHDQWPPDTGVQVALPAAIALLRGPGDDARAQVVSVRGPREPILQPYQLEQE